MVGWSEDVNVRWGEISIRWLHCIENGTPLLARRRSIIFVRS